MFGHIHHFSSSSTTLAAPPSSFFPHLKTLPPAQEVQTTYYCYCCQTLFLSSFVRFFFYISAHLLSVSFPIECHFFQHFRLLWTIITKHFLAIQNLIHVVTGTSHFWHRRIRYLFFCYQLSEYTTTEGYSHRKKISWLEAVLLLPVVSGARRDIFEPLSPPRLDLLWVNIQ